MTLYVNGVEVASGTSTTNPWQAAGKTAVGRYWLGDNPVDAFQGSIDDARLYASALTPMQVRALANMRFQPTFRLVNAPQSSVIVRRGASGSYVVDVKPMNGFTGTPTFSVSGLPVGVTASFNPPASGTSTTMTLPARVRRWDRRVSS